MNFELYIANKLKSGNKLGVHKRNTPSLTIAVFGMTLAIVIMILSITVVCGFKKEISNKIYNLDSHIKIKIDDSVNLNNSHSNIDFTNLTQILTTTLTNEISNISEIIEKSAIIKTQGDFKGVIYKGVDSNFNWNYIKKHLVAGRVPNIEEKSEIVVSLHIAKQLMLEVGQKIPTYFIDNGIKMRNSEIVGIYNTDMVDFDKIYILGNINQLSSLNANTDLAESYIGIDCKNIDKIDVLVDIIDNLVNSPSTNYTIYSTTKSNTSYFTWLKLLDMNVLIIIIIMLLVSAFTLISAMLMIVLERTNTIGLLKSLGANNLSIRRIFIYLTSKLVLRALLYGNIIGIGISLLQQNFHLLKLDAEAYYISYVPIEINLFYIVLLNIVFTIITYISLLTPSHIISRIEPQKSIKHE